MTKPTSDMASPQPLPLALFARPPIEGKTKTRLIPALGRAGATALYRAFLEDTATALCGIEELRPTIWWSEEPSQSKLQSLRLPTTPARTQVEGDLGQRMAHALEVMQSERGAGAIIGTDAPTLPTYLLRLAACLMLPGKEGPDVVLGPAADGGYYLVASRVPMQGVFEGVAWSSAEALLQTLQGILRSGHRYALLPPWYDVDTPNDLRLLRLHLASDPTAAPVTARVLQSSPARSPGGSGEIQNP